VIRRKAVVTSSPRLIPEEDFLAVIEAVLSVVVLAWIRIRRAKSLTDFHRRRESHTAGLLYHQIVLAERERQPRLPRFKIKAEVGTFSSDLELPDGRIDVEVVYSLGDDPDLRLEYKRVSSTPGDDPTRLAREYVAEGVLRFVSRESQVLRSVYKDRLYRLTMEA